MAKFVRELLVIYAYEKLSSFYSCECVKCLFLRATIRKHDHLVEATLQDTQQVRAQQPQAPRGQVRRRMSVRGQEILRH